MRYLLDTHVLVWFAAGSRRLPREHAAALRSSERLREPMGVAAITAFEVALLDAAGRLPGGAAALFKRIDEYELLEWLPLTPAVALEAMRLGSGFHRDPADQLIAATARIHELVLITADERIRDSGAVRVL